MTQKIVFDLGMNNGDDTDYYLKLGMKVIGVEANPALAIHCEKRFSDQVQSGQLVILNRAVAQEAGSIEFFVNEDNDHWSSLDEYWASRENSNVKKINVETLNIAEALSDFGQPYFMKIDIEGADQTVLEQLAESDVKPLYLSIEDCFKGYEYLSALKTIGYSNFALSDQSKVSQKASGLPDYTFPEGASGPFAEYLEADWQEYEEFLSKYAQEVRGEDLKRIAPLPTWWDIHCC